MDLAVAVQTLAVGAALAACGRVGFDGEASTRVQRGTVALSAVDTELRIPVAPVSPEHALLVLGVAGVDTMPATPRVHVSGRLEGTDTLAIVRGQPGAIADVHWQLIESNLLDVQRGFEVATESPIISIDVPITPTDGIPIVSVYEIAGSSVNADDFVLPRIEGSVLRLSVSQNDLPFIDWQVVSFAGASVTRVAGSLDATALTANHAIVPVEDRTFLNASWLVDGGGVGANLLAAELVGSDVRVSRGRTGNAIAYEVDVVTLGTGRVQSGRALLGATELATTIAIEPVDRARAFAFVSGQMRGGTTPFPGSGGVNDTYPGWFVTELIADDALEVRRGTHRDSSAEAVWFVVELP